MDIPRKDLIDFGFCSFPQGKNLFMERGDYTIYAYWLGHGWCYELNTTDDLRLNGIKTIDDIRNLINVIEGCNVQ